VSAFLSHISALRTSTSRGSLRIENETKDRTVCDRALLATSMRQRLFGLLGKRSLDPGEGLLLRLTSAVHTVGMSMSIDVVGLDRSGRVTAIYAHLKPGRIAVPGWKTRSILELPAGQSERALICVGDSLAFFLDQRTAEGDGQETVDHGSRSNVFARVTSFRSASLPVTST
jgi:uncharacterized membrane protein (UPF0127 family)